MKKGILRFKYMLVLLVLDCTFSCTPEDRMDGIDDIDDIDGVDGKDG